jgi:hypothetical protein
MKPNHQRVDGVGIGEADDMLDRGRGQIPSFDDRNACSSRRAFGVCRPPVTITPSGRRRSIASISRSSFSIA